MKNAQSDHAPQETGPARKREAELRSKLAGYKQREDELTQAIADATEEDTSDIEAAVAELETNQADTKAELKKIRDDLDKVIGEIEDAEKAQEDALAGETGTVDDGEARSRRRSAQRFDTRAAAEFQRTGRRTIKDVRRFLRAAVLSSSTGVIGPTGVGGINDPVGGPLRSHRPHQDHRLYWHGLLQRWPL